MDIICPKCGIGVLGTPNEKRDAWCQKCGRRWRLEPDGKTLMSEGPVLQVHDVTHKTSAPKIGGQNG